MMKTVSNYQMSDYDIKESFKTQKKAFAENPFPNEKLRKQQLKALKSALLQYKDKLVKAISADFGHRSHDESLLGDIMPTVMTIDYCLEHIRDWMKPEKRKISVLFKPAKASVVYQPKGVIGIISPWNYPVFLSLGPLAFAIAAGNRAMLKPSEFTPYTNRVLVDIVEQAFSKDEACMIEGDAQVAQTFSSLPFDHLFFTGSTHIGKIIMKAAAENLTPVTLELGGKSPAIVADDVSADFAVSRMLYGKCFNAGQTCVAPDYVLCPENKISDLVQSFKTQFAELYPQIDSGDFSSIISDNHYARLQSLLDEAKSQGAEIISLGQNKKIHPRMMPLTVVLNANVSMKIMQEEIFGPILPIIGYSSLNQAIQLVNARSRPLALYIFSHNQKVKNKITQQTHAGGMCFNDSIVQVAQEDLPFGGIGPSGMGSYHGKEGFLTFSHAKSIYKKGKLSLSHLAFPPYNKLMHRLIYRWFLKS